MKVKELLRNMRSENYRTIKEHLVLEFDKNKELLELGL